MHFKCIILIINEQVYLLEITIYVKRSKKQLKVNHSGLLYDLDQICLNKRP